jgi:hypothetical protein
MTLNFRGFKTSEKMKQLEYATDFQQNNIVIFTKTKFIKHLLKKIYNNRLLKLFTSWDPRRSEGSGATMHSQTTLQTALLLSGDMTAMLLQSS